MKCLFCAIFGTLVGIVIRVLAAACLNAFLITWGLGPDSM